MSPTITAFFDEATNTVTYTVAESEGKHCVIINSVLDYDPKSGRTRTESADKVLLFIRENGLIVDWILETHAHADHLTAAPYLNDLLKAPIGIGEHITNVQKIFKNIFNTGPEFSTDGSQFSHLFKDGEELKIGEMTVQVIHTPGHTPACLTYVIGDAAFVGDTLFMPDYGTGRADFPGGDATALYRSIQKILSLPPETRLFMCHDYKAPGRDNYAWESTVAEERETNIQVHQGVTEANFIKMRTERDKTLATPILLLPSVQINMRAGQLPLPENNGVSYIKIPINTI